MLADSFFSAVAEQPLSTFIPADNDAVEILTDYGVLGGFDNGRQLFGGIKASPFL